MVDLCRALTRNGACSPGSWSGCVSGEWWERGKTQDITVHYCWCCKHCPTTPPPGSIRKRTWELSALLHEQGCGLDWLGLRRGHRLEKAQIIVIVTVGGREWKVAWASVGIRNTDGERKDQRGLPGQYGSGYCMLKQWSDEGTLCSSYK